MSANGRKELPAAREVCPTTAPRLLAEGALLLNMREREELARERDVILACAAGQRSLQATYFLTSHGYDRVMNMRYGLERRAARGFPVAGEAALARQVGGGSCRGEATPAATGCFG